MRSKSEDEFLVPLVSIEVLLLTSIGPRVQPEGADTRSERSVDKESRQSSKKQDAVGTRTEDACRSSEGRDLGLYYKIIVITVCG